jgi:hypothetical protein
VHDHPGGLVDCEQVLVLEQNVQRDLDRTDFRGHDVRHRELDRIARGHGIVAPEHALAGAHEPRVERALERGPAVVREMRGKDFVRTLTRNSLGHHHPLRLHTHPNSAAMPSSSR